MTSICGMAVATAAIICVLSVFNGFRAVIAGRLDTLARRAGHTGQRERQSPTAKKPPRGFLPSKEWSEPHPPSPTTLWRSTEGARCRYSSRSRSGSILRNNLRKIAHHPRPLRPLP